MEVRAQLAGARLARRHRRLRGSLAGAAAVSTALGLGIGIGIDPLPASASGSTKPVVVFNAFTGTTAFIGPIQLAGCGAGVGEVNASGGVLGSKLTCVPVDDKSDPADAVPAATKMLTTNSNLVMVLGPPGTSAPTVTPILGAAKAVMFSGSGSPLMNKNTDQYFYRVVPSDSVAGTAMAYWAYHHGCKTAAAIFDTNSSASTVVPSLKTEYKKLGGTLAQNMLLTAGSPSYQSEASQFVSSHVQCAFTETDPQTAATFWSEVLQLTHKLPQLYGDQADLTTAYYQAVLPVVGTSFHMIALTQASPTPSPATRDYRKYLATAKGVKQPLQYKTAEPAMANADSVILAALAMNEAHSTVGSVYRPWITKISGVPKAGKTVVHTYAQGLAAIKAHKKIVYVGIDGAIEFNKYHNAASVFSALKLNPKTKGVSDVGSIPAKYLP